MKDTHPQIKHHYEKMLLSRSGIERLLMGDSMFETARELVLASVKAKNPKADDAELRCALFLRFYGHEFSDTKCQKILEALKTSSIAKKS